MRYVSTRGEAPARDFEGVLLAGLAEDGGLFMPESWPSFSAAEWRALRGLPYAEVAARVVAPFAAGCLTLEDLRGMTAAAYQGFGHAAVVPLVQLDARTHALELFHGPTLAFKDLAMQLLGQLFDHALERRGERVTIVARPPATRDRPRSRPAATGATSTSRSCIRWAVRARCSGGR